MTRDLLPALRALLLPTLALGLVVAFAPGRVEPAVRVYGLVAGFVALVVVLAALRRAYPPARPLRKPARAGVVREPPPGLGRIEHEVALGVAGAFDLHFRLVPRLRALASGLLRSRRRVSLEDDPGAARDALGEEAWALVRPDLPAPQDRMARGVPVPTLRGAVESLERI